MEKMKKVWGRPMTKVQVFTANEYIAACTENVVYSITGLGTTCNFVFDQDPYGVWEDNKEGAEIDKHINPHGGLIYFSEAARNKVMGLLSNSRAFYNTDKHALQREKGDNPQGYVIAINPDAMNAAESPNNPLQPDHVMLYTSGGGQGVFAFNIGETFHKNQS